MQSLSTSNGALETGLRHHKQSRWCRWKWPKLCTEVQNVCIHMSSSHVQPTQYAPALDHKPLFRIPVKTTHTEQFAHLKLHCSLLKILKVIKLTAFLPIPHIHLLFITAQGKFCIWKAKHPVSSPNCIVVVGKNQHILKWKTGFAGNNY